MAKSDIWMPIYIGDYLSDTMHLSTEQHGAYFLILLYGWRNDGIIPSDDESLAQICRMPLELWKNNRQVISRFFNCGEIWSQKRQLEEIEKAGNRRDASKSNGIKGGRPKNNLQVNSRLPKSNLDHNLEKSSLQLPLQLHKEKEERSTGEPVAVTLPKAKSKEFSKDEVPYKAARFFWEYVREWSPSALEPTESRYQAWAKDLDLLFRVDGRSTEAFNELMDWIDKLPEARNGFSWRKNILSPSTLRQRWKEGKFADFLPSELNREEYR